MKTCLCLLTSVIIAFLIGCENPGEQASSNPGSVDDETHKTTTEVYQYDGSVQCQQGSGISLDDMAAELTDNNIHVVSAYRDVDGNYRIALCGVGTGVINVFEIYETDLDSALTLGFNLVSDLPGLYESGDTSE